MAEIQYHLFRSKNHPDKAITVGEFPSGLYFLPTLATVLDQEENRFASIDEIEALIGDELEMIIKKDG